MICSREKPSVPGVPGVFFQKKSRKQPSQEHRVKINLESRLFMGLCTIIVFIFFSFIFKHIVILYFRAPATATAGGAPRHLLVGGAGLSITIINTIGIIIIIIYIISIISSNICIMSTN